jgi:SNF2 family DNA or RNA helicase
MSLWSHQEAAIEWSKDRVATLLHHQPGCGKTRTAITIALKAAEESGATRFLACCPKAVVAAWQKQLGLWAPHLRVLTLTKGTSRDKEKALKEALADSTPLIVVLNYETAWRIDHFTKVSWDILIWDEIHRLKAPSGKCGKWAAKMAEKNPQARKVGLSGTMVPHSILDVFGIWRAVEAPECPTFGKSYVAHRSTYAIMNPRQPGMVIGWRNLDKAKEKIAATTHYVRTRDVIDLPEIQYLDRTVDLNHDEAAVYREIEREFIAVVGEDTVSPKNALEQLLRLQQICGGYVKFDGEKTARKISDHPSKASALSDMLEDLDENEPLVVFCRFRSDIEAVRAACTSSGRTVSELSGSADGLSDWQLARTTVLVAQIQSGGIGIDLTRAAYGIFYSLGYSLSEYEQAVARLHRPGQEQKTTIYHLVATIHGRPTMDGRVYEALRDRKEVLSGIIDAYRHAVTA